MNGERRYRIYIYIATFTTVLYIGRHRPQRILLLYYCRVRAESISRRRRRRRKKTSLIVKMCVCVCGGNCRGRYYILYRYIIIIYINRSGTSRGAVAAAEVSVIIFRLNVNQILANLIYNVYFLI